MGKRKLKDAHLDDESEENRLNRKMRRLSKEFKRLEKKIRKCSSKYQ